MHTARGAAHSLTQDEDDQQAEAFGQMGDVQRQPVVAQGRHHRSDRVDEHRHRPQHVPRTAGDGE